MSLPRKPTSKEIERARNNARLCQQGRIIAWWPEYEAYTDTDDTPKGRKQVGAENIYATVSWDGLVERVKP